VSLVQVLLNSKVALADTATGVSLIYQYSASDAVVKHSVICYMFSVMRGIGEMDVNQPPPTPSVQPIDDSCPYLILDVRDRDEYDACHLVTGMYHGHIICM